VTNKITTLTDLSRRGLSRLIERLARQGLVSREPFADGGAGDTVSSGPVVPMNRPRQSGTSSSPVSNPAASDQSLQPTSEPTLTLQDTRDRDPSGWNGQGRRNGVALTDRRVL
jgi:hypothetical protein